MAVTLTRNDVVACAKALKSVPVWVPAAEIGSHWLQIFAALAVFFWYPTWWLYIAVFLFISARQYGLAILLHDAQHTLLHRNKAVNKWLGTWLVAAPLGAEFSASQKSHLDHHFHFGSAHDDPDYALYCFGPPSPKQSTWQVAVLFLAKLFGSKVVAMLQKNDAAGQATHGAKVGLPVRLFRLALRLWPAICVHLVLLAALTWLFGWYGYLGLWALPLATLAAFYNDFRIFCEHSLVGREAVEPDERMISFLSNPVELFFIAPNHMNYHAEHHMFPYVPHRNLPALRKAVQACPELNDRIAWRPSYFGHFIAYIDATRLQAPAEPFLNNQNPAQLP